MTTLTADAANAQANAVREQLRGGRVELSSADGPILVFELADFLEAQDGRIVSKGELQGTVQRGDMPLTYRVLGRNGKPLVHGPAAELGAARWMAAGARVTIEQFAYQVPL